MLRSLVWQLLATADRMNFKKIYRSINQESIDASPSARTRALKNLLCHAYTNVPYYRSLFRRAGVFKNGGFFLANFENIPLLTKVILRKWASELVSRDGRTRGRFYDFSSGSTGEPVKFLLDKTFQKWVWATENYYYKDMLGIDQLFARKILLWAPPPRKMSMSKRVRYVTNNALTNAKLLDPRHMSRSRMEKYVRVINSYKPQIVRGYAHALYEFSRFVDHRKLTIYKPNAVISSAEILYPHMREKIEDAFSTKVFEIYGCREVNGIAGECREGSLHIFAFNNHVELLGDNNNKVNEGENGRVVLTNLHNYSLPFIRYQIGDMAILGPEKCACGSPLPTLKSVSGRMNSFLRKEDGTLVSSLCLSRIFLPRQTVHAFRVIQEDYKRIRILIVFGEKRSEESEKGSIEEEVKLLMGRDCKVLWEVVDEIPKTRAGKYLPVRSLLSE